PDRMRQITEALAKAGVDRYATLTEYQEEFPYPVAFPPERPAVTMASVLAERGTRQLHVAETEKYPHVTYFFNGGEEHPYPGEERCLVESPRDVPTYDHKPEMSADAAATAFAERWRGGDYEFGVINFANPDMVGHTGVIPAAVKAIETVDECLARVVAAVHDSGGALIVTADHGNCDHMLEPDGSPNTAHSLNPVPFIVTREGVRLAGPGILADRDLKQLHVAETEKYPHVTYFFNGGEEARLPGERRELVDSPRDVPTYDHKPQMSAREAADAFVRAWGEEEFRFAIINFANPDMVGHTGVIEAAVQAVETVDACLGDVVRAVHESGGACIVTADHGNADHMLEPDGSPNTAHSLNPVPLIVTVEGAELRAGGVLADVAPTALELLGIEQPDAMTGRSLLEE
ncbi:MAG: 2,3-bisphosphoglycerate-independent phosphoglycerate mutase, partial [Solirubrobacteraceae bacterium]|nr:2,3-bisphosphoglycerate-independent phosphoglycerate mutase [Solirubrobacteraceae bacterium]